MSGGGVVVNQEGMMGVKFQCPVTCIVQYCLELWE